MSAVTVRVMMHSEAEAPEAVGAEQAAEESLSFYSGNPRVERVSGVVHLYGSVVGESASSKQALPLTDTICALSVPGWLSVSDFCKFAGAFLPRVREMRLVRDQRQAAAKQSAFMVLLAFDNVSGAEEFYRFYHGKPFTSLEPDKVCHLLFVRSVEYSSSEGLPASPHSHFPRLACLLPPPPGQTELPACPVCLERLDTSISGLITTMCNHTFHTNCLAKVSDSSCPVCRYCHEPPDESECAVCGSSENLWICLVCGSVGCGRYAAGHAISHWRATGHCYSLEVATQRVWDYHGDGYVHRLIASKTHGHLVELTHPGRGGGRGRGGADALAESEACGGAGGDAEEEDGLGEAMLSSKLDSVGLEYNQLLASQLESQREYFQTLITAARGAEERARGEAEEAAAEAAEAQRARRAAERRAEEAGSRLAALRAEAGDLRSLNEQLLSNQRDAAAGRERAEGEQRARVAELEEQVRDLMLFIEAQSAVAGSGELHDGDVVKLRAPPGEAAAAPVVETAAAAALRQRLERAKGERRRKS